MTKYNNVFILCTGRCGSETFVRACSHITNYSAGHETRSRLIGNERLDYPHHHIEADNRLSWLLGRLYERHKDNSFFVHLRRDPAAVARSYAKRAWWDGSITKAYRNGILMLNQNDEIDLCADYVKSVEKNIEHFLERCDAKMEFWIERYDQDFPQFWQEINAEGDLQAALAEFTVRSNTSEEMEKRKRINASISALRFARKAARRLVARGRR